MAGIISPNIVSANEIWDSSCKGQINEWLVRTYVRKFRVVMSITTAGPLEATQTAVIPAMYTVYTAQNGEKDLGATARTIEPVRDSEDPFTWTVTVSYSSAPFTAQRRTQQPSQAGDSSETNPLMRPPEIEWTSVQFQKPLWQDNAGSAIVNSAGERYDPPIEIDDSRPSLKIVINQPSFDGINTEQYVNCINKDDFWGGKHGTWKVAGISAVSVFENNFYYWRCTYEFHYRAEGWALQILDWGPNELGPNGDLRPIRSKDSQAAAAPLGPTLLDGSGHRAVIDNTLVPPAIKPFFKTLNSLYTSVNFGLFNLPQGPK